ncbi:MAG: hypothetical protein PHR82_07400 [Endomicrobiaceae bacterium]|nr:hypothetical protein [Endomicrobiaceae bacterium]
MREIVDRQFTVKLFQFIIVKKTLVLFIFLCMLINGFTPSSQEGRNSLIVILASTAHNPVSEIFVSCNDSLAGISNKIAESLYGLFLGNEAKTVESAKDENKESPSPVNTLFDNGIINDRREEIKTWNSNGKQFYKYTSYLIMNKLYRLYENVEEDYSAGVAGLGLLMFLLFVILTVRRKEISENIKIKEYRKPVLV